MTTTEHTTTNPDEYNGWTNRETWATALHLSNDQWLYNTTRGIVARADAEQTEWQVDHDCDNPGTNLGGFAADAVERFVIEAVDEVLHVTPGEEWARMMIADVGSFWRVDWHDVAASFRDE